MRLLPERALRLAGDLMPLPLTPSTLCDWLDDLALSPSARATLTSALTDPATFQSGLRGSYLAPLHGWMDAQAEPIRQGYQGLRDRLPDRAPFAFVPTAEILLLLARASSLLWPDAQLLEGCNRVAESYIASMANHAMLSAMMATCNHDLFEYLDLVSNSWHLWYNFGSRTNRRASSLHMVLRYADTFTQAGALWQPGLNRGLLRLFQRGGDVRFTPVTDADFTIDVALHPT
jgi:hypothetical protein